MKKRKVLLSSMAAVAMITISYHGISSLRCDDELSNYLVIENVEALTQINDVTPKGWSSTHLACYQTVTVNGVTYTQLSGKYQGITWPNDNSNKGPHSHFCNSCSSI